MENNKIEIVERYLPKRATSFGKTYKDISEIVKTVYVLSTNGNILYDVYDTKEEAEEAALKLDTVKYLEELRKRANAALEKLRRFRFKLSELNYLYVSLKHKTPEAQKFHNFIESANKNNHVINLLHEKDKQKMLCCFSKRTSYKCYKRIQEIEERVSFYKRIN